MLSFLTKTKVTNLTDSQNIAYDAYLEGKNILISGQAGTGKSHLIKKIVAHCDRIKKQVAVTAMTGAAACLVNGKTIHSWGSLGLGDKSSDFLADKILKSWPKRTKWQRTRLLIIDEVSMMNAIFFELLEEVARLVRGSERPFGGMQVIFLGDFYQLPPVSKVGEDDRFCFESNRWKECIDKVVILKEIMRQKDPVFQKVLSEVRIGRVSDESIQIIQSRVGVEPDLSSGIIPTMLYSTKKSVDKINKEEFDKLPDETVIEYETIYEIVGERTSKIRDEEFERYKEIVDKENNYEKVLHLSIGAQVMLLKNLDQEKGLVNGSRGVIMGFNEKDLPLVKFVNNEIEEIDRQEYVYEISGITNIVAKQVPLALAWCSTIHKSQGQSLDCVKINIGKGIFEYGQTYVALSRARNLEGLFIEEFDPKRIKVHPKVLEYLDET